jgi:hypothetical protein
MQMLVLWNVFACWRAIRERSAWRVNPYYWPAVLHTPYTHFAANILDLRIPPCIFLVNPGLESLTVPSYGVLHTPQYTAYGECAYIESQILHHVIIDPLT